jgi:YbbR domain-containing protein
MFEGNYFFENKIYAKDENNFVQRYMVNNGGDKWLTDVQVDIFYDGTEY